MTKSRSVRWIVFAMLLVLGLAAMLLIERGDRQVAVSTAPLAAAAHAAEKAPPPPTPTYECRWTSGPIKIDGQGDDEAWKGAQVIDRFVVGWLPSGVRKGVTSTKARLLWDNDNLYFFCDMEDADLYADVKDQDGETWTNDVFELFFKPAKNKRGYYEFEISANNTILDMFLPSRGSGGYQRWGRDAKFHLKTATALRGTINEWQDTDQGWSVEGLIPWADFAPTGGKPQPGDQWPFTLTRYDYSVAFERPELSATAPLSRPDFHYYEDYTPLRFVGPKN